MGDMLSQDEINALLGGEDAPEPTEGDASTNEANPNGADISQNEIDVLGEIGNISMGTSATTLYALLGEKVLITTPDVRVMEWEQIAEEQERPCVGIHVDYTEGISGSNVLILKQRDVKVISSLMMGNEGEIDEEAELSEIDLSAIAEAMNQMVGSASTSLSSLMDMKIDIDTPKAFELDFKEDSFLEKLQVEDDTVVCIGFKMGIGDLVDSEIMQILPLKFAKHLVEKMEAGLTEGMKPDHKVPDPMPLPADGAAEATPEQPVTPEQPAPAPAPQPQVAQQPVQEQQVQQPVAQGQMQATSAAVSSVDARPAEFQSFDSTDMPPVQKENMDIIMDVPLEVTVELGKTSKKIKDILEFTPGTIVELNRLAGEPIDVLVNGKEIAKGEVVVIEENFCIRIVDIISPEDRI